MPPPSPFPDDHRSSIETEPRTAYDEPQWPESPETLAERTEARRMAMKGESARGRTDVSLQNLSERTKTRSYDQKTPELINGIAVSESPEEQQEKLDALRDVSVIMLATLLYNHPDLEKKFDLADFANIPLFGETLAQSNPRPAENTAFHKLRELRDHPESETAKYFSREWPTLVSHAREISRDIGVVASTDFTQALQESDRWTVRGAIASMPKPVKYGLAIAGAVAGFFLLRGIYRAFTRSSDEAEKAGDQKDEKPKSKWGWLKWAIGGALAVFGFGYIFGWDKTIDWIKKQGGRAKEAWDKLFGEDPEFAKNKEMYTRMAGRIGNEMSGGDAKVKIDPKFLASRHNDKYEDVIDDDSWVYKNTIEPVLDSDAMSSVAKYLPGHPVFTKEERNQYRAIRAYLQGTDRQALIAEIGIGSNATLGDVLAKLDEKLNEKEGVQAKPGERAAEWNLARVEGSMLPYFKENYGTEIAPEDFRRITNFSYRDFMAGKGARSYFESLRGAAREAGAEAGVTTATTPAEQRLIDAENIVRRFFLDHEDLLSSLHLPDSLPAGATVGSVMLALLKAGKLDELKKKDTTETLQGIIVKDDEVEGSRHRDEIAKKLPEDLWNLYRSQKKELRNLVDSGNYAKTGDAQKLMAVGRDLIDKINKKAMEEPDKKKRNAIFALASGVRAKIASLEHALKERTDAWHSFDHALENNPSTDSIHEAFLQVMGKNKDVSNAYADLEKPLVEERKWRSVGIVVALQGLRIGYIHYTTHDIYKAWLENYYGRFGVPTALVKRLNKRVRRPASGIDLLKRQISEGEDRLRGKLANDLKTRAKVTDESAPLPSEKEIAGFNDPNHRTAMRRYKSEKALLEHNRKLLDLEREVADLERDASLLRKRPSDPTVVASLTAIEEQLAERGPALKQLRMDRIELSKQALGHATEDLYKNLDAAARKGALTPDEFGQLDDLARRSAEHNRELMRAGDGLLKDIQRAAARGDAAEVARLQKMFNDTIAEIPKMQKGAIGRFFDFIGTFFRERKNISRSVVDTELNDIERKSFRKVFAHLLHWQREKAAPAAVTTENMSMLRIVGKKLRFFKLAVGGSLAAAAGVATRDKQTGVLPAIGHAAFDIAPFTGEYSDFYALATGRQIFTGRKIGKFERFVVRPGFGLLGLASDALLVLSFGTTFGVSAGVSSLKGAYGAAKLAKMGGEALAKGVVKGAEKEAGARIGVKAVETAGEAAAKTLARETAEAGAKVAAETGATEVGKLATVLRRIQKGGAVATVGLGIAGLTMSLIQSDEIEATPAMDAIAGGADGKIDDIDIEKLAEEAGDAE
ncbi:hypothetical protein HYW83_02500 [Candidatus Peregrinibacteria bacterium]|nr:hypothetical protein [Candidatus Peregrinibacteria bacterium]